jgi:hypothetical protein
VSNAESDLCKRFYELNRTHQPTPDLINYLTTSSQVITQRLATRHRTNIAVVEDIPLLDSFLEKWLGMLTPGRLLRLDVSENGISIHRVSHHF